MTMKIKYAPILFESDAKTSGEITLKDCTTEPVVRVSELRWWIEKMIEEVRHLNGDSEYGQGFYDGTIENLEDLKDYLRGSDT